MNKAMADQLTLKNYHYHISTQKGFLQLVIYINQFLLSPTY